MSKVIRTPDQRLRVFVSSTLQEVAPERAAARSAISTLRLTPVLFELGARPHPPQELYRAYLEQSHVFVGIYWQRYGWVAPNMTISGLEDEYRLSKGKPRLIYLKHPAPEMEPRLKELLDTIRREDVASYQRFETPEELRELLQNDLSLLLTESFERSLQGEGAPGAGPLSRRRSNLPIPPTTFVGREAEIATVRELLQREDVRAVTLTGPGGSGKTRLAIEIAMGLAEAHPDGAWFVPLAALTDATDVMPAIAAALELEPPPGRALADAVHDALSDKRALLVLDSFERLLEAAPAVAALLAAAPRVRVLVTSRVPLHIRGEGEFPVEPLTPAHAVELFVRRARQVRPDFAARADNADTLVGICERLDRLPLAIELAATRVKLFPLPMLLSRLTKRLDLLVGGARDLPARQQTLRGTIEWSHNLLDDAPRLLFRRLGVFAGGCTLEAAEAVANADHDLGPDVLDAMITLVDNSLVRQQVGRSGEPRFAMLETIREYALERLAESGEERPVRERHARCFDAFAAVHGRRWGPEREVRAARMADELQNVEGAIQWAQATPGLEPLALDLAARTVWVWLGLGLAPEKLPLAEAALGRAPATTDALTRAVGLRAVGALRLVSGKGTEAREPIDEAVRLLRGMENPVELILALIMQGQARLYAGDPAGAQAAFAEVAALSRAIDDPNQEAYVLPFAAQASLAQGAPSEARRQLERCIELVRVTGDEFLMVQALTGLAALAAAEGDFAGARRMLEEVLPLSDRGGDWTAGWEPRILLAEALRELGESAEAARHLRTALDLVSGKGFAPAVATVLVAVAAAATRPEEGARLIGAAEAMLAASGARHLPRVRPFVERAIGAVRLRLPEAEFDAALERGRALRATAAASEARAVLVG